MAQHSSAHLHEISLNSARTSHSANELITVTYEQMLAAAHMQELVNDSQS